MEGDRWVMHKAYSCLSLLAVLGEPYARDLGLDWLHARCNIYPLLVLGFLGTAICSLQFAVFTMFMLILKWMGQAAGISHKKPNRVLSSPLC